MEDKFIFISGDEDMLVNPAQIAFVLVKSDSLVLNFSGGQQLNVRGAGAAELREQLKGRTVMTNGVPMPAEFAL